MSRTRNYILAFVPLLLLSLAYLFWMASPANKPITPLSVTFAGWATNPVPRMVPTRLAVCQEATGVCALFWVTNTGAFKQTLWFDTSQVEQKIDGQWRVFVPTNQQWKGVEGSVWFGGYGCLFAVGWPPGLATNVTWRLQVRCGADRSPTKVIIEEKLGRRVFDRSEDYNLSPSSGVIP